MNQKLVFPFLGGQTFPNFWDAISSEETGLEEISTSYFYAGFTDTETLEFLNVYRGHQISLSTLKRRFKTLDLYRKPLIPWTATVGEVKNSVQKELDASGTDLGYRKTILELNAEGVQ